MWHRGHGFYGFRFFPFGFFCHPPRPFPRRGEYLRMLEHYRDELKEELGEVEKEIEELKRGETR